VLADAASEDVRTAVKACEGRSLNGACVEGSVRGRGAADRRLSGRGSELGMALVLVLTAMLLLLVAVAGLVLAASAEEQMEASYRRRQEDIGAAEAVLERALQELSGVADWTSILAGASPGPTDVTPWLSGWGLLDLVDETARLQREQDSRNRWGADGARWRLIWSRPENVTGRRGVHGVAWLADDVWDGDGDPLVDRNGVVTVRAEVFGPLKSRVAVLATVVRRGGNAVEIVSWRWPAPVE